MLELLILTVHSAPLGREWSSCRRRRQHLLLPHARPALLQLRAGQELHLPDNPAQQLLDGRLPDQHNPAIEQRLQEQRQQELHSATAVPMDRDPEPSGPDLLRHAVQQQPRRHHAEARHHSGARAESGPFQVEDNGHRRYSPQHRRRATNDANTTVRGWQFEDLHGQHGANGVLDVAEYTAHDRQRAREAAQEEDREDREEHGVGHVSGRLFRALPTHGRRGIRRKRFAASVQRCAIEASASHDWGVRCLHETSRVHH